MSRARIVVEKQHEILRLKLDCGLSARRIAEALDISAGAVRKVVKAAGELRLRRPLEGVETQQLSVLLYGDGEPSCSAFAIDFERVHQEKQKPAVTLKLVWMELGEQGLGCSYSHFCELYSRWAKTQQRPMRQEHEPGDTAFVDCCGMTVAVDMRSTQIFAGVPRASGCIFAVAAWTQRLRGWLERLTRMLEFSAVVSS